MLQCIEELMEIKLKEVMIGEFMYAKEDFLGCLVPKLR